MMKIELSVYLFFIGFLIAYRHILSGKKNGCFYHKNDSPLPPYLKREIENIHFLETPAWYALELVAFLGMFSIERAINYSLSISTIFFQILIAALFMMGTFHLPSYYFQKGVTAGLRDNEHLDSRLDSEVAIVIFGIRIQFWKGRLFSNSRRKLAQWLGLVEIIISIILLWIN